MRRASLFILMLSSACVTARPVAHTRRPAIALDLEAARALAARALECEDFELSRASEKELSGDLVLRELGASGCGRSRLIKAYCTPERCQLEPGEWWQRERLDATAARRGRFDHWHQQVVVLEDDGTTWPRIDAEASLASVACRIVETSAHCEAACEPTGAQGYQPALTCFTVRAETAGDDELRALEAFLSGRARDWPEPWSGTAFRELALTTKSERCAKQLSARTGIDGFWEQLRHGTVFVGEAYGLREGGLWRSNQPPMRYARLDFTLFHPAWRQSLIADGTAFGAFGDSAWPAPNQWYPHEVPIEMFRELMLPAQVQRERARDCLRWPARECSFAQLATAEVLAPDARAAPNTTFTRAAAALMARDQAAFVELHRQFEALGGHPVDTRRSGGCSGDDYEGECWAAPASGPTGDWSDLAARLARGKASFAVPFGCVITR